MTERNTPKIRPIDPELRKSVSESFNIYLGTVTIVAIFLGFVFSALLQLLIYTEPITSWIKWGIRLLAVSMVLLCFALFCFHATAHKIVRYWGIFYPVSIYNIILGAPAFLLGVLTMFLCIAALLHNKEMNFEAVLVGLSAVGLVLFAFYFRSMHGNASYMTKVD